MFRRHARTTFISAHLSWLGHDLARLGRTLDSIPNMHVEVAAALYEIGRQPRAGRELFVKYQDRILMGKDTFGGVDEFAVYFRIFETTDEYFPLVPSPTPPGGCTGSACPTTCCARCTTPTRCAW
jgi:hypothetical protein